MGIFLALLALVGLGAVVMSSGGGGSSGGSSGGSTTGTITDDQIALLNHAQAMLLAWAGTKTAAVNPSNYGSLPNDRKSFTMAETTSTDPAVSGPAHDRLHRYMLAMTSFQKWVNADPGRASCAPLPETGALGVPPRTLWVLEQWIWLALKQDPRSGAAASGDYPAWIEAPEKTEWDCEGYTGPTSTYGSGSAAKSGAKSSSGALGRSNPFTRAGRGINTRNAPTLTDYSITNVEALQEPLHSQVLGILAGHPNQAAYQYAAKMVRDQGYKALAAALEATGADVQDRYNRMWLSDPNALPHNPPIPIVDSLVPGGGLRSQVLSVWTNDASAPAAPISVIRQLQKRLRDGGYLRLADHLDIEAAAWMTRDLGRYVDANEAQRAAGITAEQSQDEATPMFGTAHG